MKGAVFEGIGKIEIREVPEPTCERDQILVRVHSCAICGTDLRTFRHGKSNVQAPQILGHEVAGTIAEVGESVKNFKVDDRVTVAAIVSCGTCYYCSRGLQNLCAHFTAIGYEWAGGFAEYMAVPARLVKDGSVNKIPANLSFDEACLAEPFACAINGQEISKIELGDTVVIVGAGPIGCMHGELAKIQGATKVILAELSPRRLKMAKRFNADVYINPAEEDLVKRVLAETHSRGADVIIIAAPSGKAQEQALQMVKCRGKINFFGGLPKDNPFIRLNSNIVHYKELLIQGTSGSLPRHNQIALKLFASERINAKKFITHTFPLEQILEGIRVVESGEGLKVVINP